jgi:hypothetical protein
VTYDFPTIENDVGPHNSTGYLIYFTANSSFAGVYIIGDLRGAQAIQAVAGLSGSPYYLTFYNGTSNSIDVKYVVPEGSLRPYVIGALNPSNSSQTLYVDSALIATCGSTWISTATIL